VDSRLCLRRWRMRESPRLDVFVYLGR